MGRQRVTMEQLQALIEDELPEGIEVGPLYLRRDPDSAGCNWSDTVNLRGDLRDLDRQQAVEAIDRIRQRYNLIPD